MKSKLNIRFHNPNSAEMTAEYITKILVDVNKQRIDRIMKDEATKVLCKDEQESRCIG